MRERHPAGFSAKNSLKKIDALLGTLVRASSVATFLVDGHMRLVYSNDALAGLLGYTSEELVGVDFTALVHPDEIDAARSTAEDALVGGGQSLQSEQRYIAKDGRIVTVLASVAMIGAAERDMPYMAVQAVCLERQKRAEAALLESERRWNFALESAGQGVWEADIAHNGVYYSPMWRQMRGLTVDEFVDSSEEAWLGRIHPDDRDRIREITRRQNTE